MRNKRSWKRTWIFFFLLVAGLQVGAQNSRWDYVERFYRVAQQEQARYGIPASITLAQGILESDGGNSKLFREARNSFGIQCKNKGQCPAGHCVKYTDAGVPGKYLKYSTLWHSFRAHSIYITSGKYSDMRSVCGNDPKKWAKRLREKGYSCTKDYDTRLNRVIKTYNLEKYDTTD